MTTIAICFLAAWAVNMTFVAAVLHRKCETLRRHHLKAMKNPQVPFVSASRQRHTHAGGNVVPFARRVK